MLLTGMGGEATVSILQVTVLDLRSTQNGERFISVCRHDALQLQRLTIVCMTDRRGVTSSCTWRGSVHTTRPRSTPSEAHGTSSAPQVSLR